MNQTEFVDLVNNTHENLKKISLHMSNNFERNAGILVAQSRFDIARVSLRLILEAFSSESDIKRSKEVG